MTSITREELYEAVWEAPLTKLAQRFGVSDVAVAKACRKRGIPLPGLGHWAKVAAGHRISRPPLPQADPGNGPMVFRNLTEVHAEAAALEAQVIEAHRLDEVEVKVPERLGSPHGLTAMTRRQVQGLRPDSNGIVYCRPPSGYDMGVSRAQLSRALRILDTLVRELERRGANVMLKEEGRSMCALISEEELKFSLRENCTQIRTAPSKSGADRGPLETYGRRYTYASTGKLQIRIDAYTKPPVQRTWSDGRKPLEERLGDVVRGFFVAGEAAHQQTLVWEQERRRWREEARKREEEEERRARERRETELLVREAKAWADADTIAAYLRAISQTLGDGEPGISDEGQKWLASARIRAARINPLNKRLEILRGRQNGDDEVTVDDDDYE